MPDRVLAWQDALAQEATPSVLLAEGFTAVYDSIPTGATVSSSSLPAIRFAVITDPTRRHAFFWASAAADFDRMLAAYAADDELTAEPFEFTEP
ncbi:hypothetical protein ACWEKM_45830 [Streptomyces sp. NPDC004752]